MTQNKTYILELKTFEETLNKSGGSIISLVDNSQTITGFCSLQPSLRCGKRLALCIDGPYLSSNTRNPESDIQLLLKKAIRAYSEDTIDLTEFFEIYGPDILTDETLENYSVVIEALIRTDFQKKLLLSNNFTLSHSFIDMASGDLTQSIQSLHLPSSEYEFSLVSRTEYPHIFRLLNLCFEHDTTQVVINVRFNDRFQKLFNVSSEDFVLFSIKHNHHYIAFRLLMLDTRGVTNKSVYMGGIGVLPHYRGRGLGKYLMNESFKYVSQKNINRAALTVLSDNHTAIKLNQEFGFKKVGHERDYYTLTLTE